jgi:hypothetical protein
MQKTASASVPLITGLFLLGMAIFAHKLGLDPNPGWGRGRAALLVLGLGITLLPWIGRRPAIVLGRVKYSDLFALPALLLVMGIYFWFVSISHESTSNYYSLLATSFRNGELALALKPDPALLQLPNPYDPAERQGIKVPLDLSLFRGKFYLYWGPAPALLLAIAQPFLPPKIGEVDLLFVFMSGIFLAEFMLIMNLWDRFFPEIPKWILILCIFLAGLANPALWLLSQPKIYEAAIAGAQFFFISGLLSAVQAMESEPPSALRLILAGIFWALAVATRSVMVFPVIFMTAMVIYGFFQKYRQSILKFTTGLIPLGLPLVLGALGFGWYNWRRFGSVLETGFSYQLAGHDLQKHLNELFLPGYIVQNLYNYFLNPFLVKPSFPFLFPARGVVREIFPSQVLPALYTAQAITGFLCTTPFVVFAILPVITLWKQLFKRSGMNMAGGESRVDSFGWISASLIGSFLLPFLSLLAFFWAAMRYAEDFMPELILLGIIGFWQGYRGFSEAPRKGKLYVTLGAILAVISILAGGLLALSTYFANGLL